ncbi:metallophosphoesterase [Furfurilactobacillus sp. WILCCON 0119]
MVRVAITSDNHFDVNQLDSDELLKHQAVVLSDRHIDYYVIAGDTFNDFTQTVRYVDRLQHELGSQTEVVFLAGNHDMGHGVTYSELETRINAHYLHNQFIDLPNTNWRLIGNNGWYDYTFAEQLFNERAQEDFAQWKRAFWYDGIIEQPMTDPEREDIVLTQTANQLLAANEAHRQILYVTHFVPRAEYIRVTTDNRFWNMANALLGSRRLGEVLTKGQVNYAQFGHLHIKPAPRELGGVMYFDQAVGYHTHRANEWGHQDFMSEWLTRLRILDLE